MHNPDQPQYPQPPQHDPYPPYNRYQPDYPRRHGLPVLKIIGTMLLVMVIICGGLVTYVAYNFPKWAAALARGPLVAAIDQTDLPAEQKTIIKHNIARVAQAFQAGQISFSQLKSILARLADGPLSRLVMVEAVKYQYAQTHPVADDERAETMLVFERFQRGIVEGTISDAKLDKALGLIKQPAEQNRQLTEAEIKPFIDAMRAAVDEANIPTEPFQPDYAAEIEKAVVAVLGPGNPLTATRPATAPAALPTSPDPPAAE